MRQAVDLTVDGRIATVTMRRPDVRNALTGTGVLEGLLDSFDRVAADGQVTVVIITGEGPAFSAGGNVKDMRAGRDPFGGDPHRIEQAYQESVLRLMRTVASLDAVTIAAVNGPAVGGGCDLALLCDLRVASASARFAQPVVDLGLIPGDGGAWILPRIVGWQRAAELLFTGRFVEADEALRLDMVLEVVPLHELSDRVAELAGRIAAKPPHAVRLTKRLLRHARTTDFDTFLDMTAAFQAISHHTEDHRRAIE